MTPALQQRLDEARRRKAPADVERPSREIDWNDVGRSAATGTRSGLESLFGSLGDIGDLQSDLTSYGASAAGLSPEAADMVGTYTNPMSMFASTEDIGEATDQFTGRDDLTRHIATSPQGQNIQTASEFASGLIGGPENLGKELGVKAATMTPEALKFAMLLLPRHGFGKIGEEAVDTGTKTLRHQMFDNKLPIAVEDMNAKYRPREMAEDRIFSPEEMKIGDVVIPAVGDTTLAGYDLAELGGRKIDDVNMHGGGDFPRDNPEVWASGPAQITKLEKQITEAQKVAEGNRVLLANTIMGGQSPDFAHMPAEILRQLSQGEALDPAAEAAFNKFMREDQWTDYDPVPDFPGIKSDELADYLVGYGKGDARKKMVKGAAQGRWKGSPLAANAAQARWASIDPDLLNEPSGMVGRSISEVKPGGIVTDPARKNLSYPHHYAGEHKGRFEKLVPREIVFRDWWEKQAGKTNRSQIDRSQLMSKIRQPVDQQMIDEIMEYQRTGEKPKR